MADTQQPSQTQSDSKLNGPLSTFTPPAKCFSEFAWYISTGVGTNDDTALAVWGQTSTDTALYQTPCYPSDLHLSRPGVCPEGWTAISTVIPETFTTPTTSTSIQTTSASTQTNTESLVGLEGTAPGPVAVSPKPTSSTSSSLSSSDSTTNPTATEAIPQPVRRRAAPHHANERRDDPETTIVCCPSGFGALKQPGDSSGYCYSTLFDGPGPHHPITLYYSSNIGQVSFSPTVSASGKPYISVFYAVGNQVAAHAAVLSLVRATALQVRHQGEVSSATNTPGNGGAGAATAGLSTGGIVGLTVGVVVGVLLLALAAFVLWRRRREHRRLIHPAMAEMPDTQRFEKDGKNVDVVSTFPYELDSSRTPPGPQELHATEVAVPAAGGVSLAGSLAVDQELAKRTSSAGENNTFLPNSRPLAPWETEVIDPVQVPLPGSPEPSGAGFQPLESPPPTDNEARGMTPDPTGDKLEQMRRELQRVKLQRERLQQMQQLESRETELEALIAEELARRS